MNAETLSRGDFVRHPRWPGVAFWFIGYLEHQTFDEWGEYDDIEVDTSTAIIVMVGDDYQHSVPAEELVKIDEDDFCGGCGQIGCAHGGR